VRLASQLIGWQLDLFGSREWLERGAEAALFGGGEEGEYESTDFSLRDLDLAPATLAALEAAGYNTFYDVIDMDREDFLRIPGFSGDEADRLVSEIERLTVEEDDDDSAPAEGGDEAGEPAADLTFGDDSENLPGSE
jgi:N utilization substance protein A